MQTVDDSRNSDDDLRVTDVVPLQFVDDEKKSRWCRRESFRRLLHDKRFYVALAFLVFFIIIVIVVAVTTKKSKPHGNGNDDPSPTPCSCILNADSDYRLPHSVLPSHYEVFIRTLFDEKEENNGEIPFEGQVNISISIEQDTSCVVLNTKKLTLGAGSRIVLDGEEVQLDESVSVDEVHEVSTFRVYDAVNRYLQKGRKGWMLIPFSGFLWHDMAGYYASTYDDVGCTSAECDRLDMGATQFETTDARGAFPCFDEPSFKASYHLSLSVPRGSSVHSNTPEIAASPLERSADPNHPTFDIAEFEATKVPFSTYLLAWIVVPSGMNIIRAHDDIKDINYEVMAVPMPDNENKKFAMDNAISCMQYYLDMFSTSPGYPFSKISLAAIPDFSAGAMENWGLVTFRDTALLLNDSLGPEISEQQKLRVATVVCHELAHFYFGDLITTVWWNELWLNEGFATFLEYLSVDHVHPEWDIWNTDWLYGNVGPMLMAPQTHALVKSNEIVESPEQTDELFDSISYNKGGALLHMIYNVMGEDDFFEGLNKLCSDHAFGNVDTNDLWDALDSVKNGEYHIRERFDPWARQNGFPLVSVERISEEVLRVTQTSSEVSSSGDTDGGESLWWIPLNMLKKDGQITNVVLTQKSSDIPISAGDAWVKLNAGLSGIYRVQYDKTLLQELGKAMEGGMNSVLSVGDRYELLEDTFAFAFDEKMNISMAMDLFKHLYEETHLTVWTSALSNLQKFDVLLREDISYGDFRTFFANLTMSPLKYRAAMGTRTIAMLRRMAAYCGNEEAIQETLNVYHQSAVVSGDERTSIYGSYVHHGGVSAFWDMYHLYMASNQTCADCRLALGNTPYRYLLSYLLEKSLDPTFVRPQDLVYFIRSIAQNIDGYDLAFVFLRERFDDLLRVLPTRWVNRLIGYVVMEFTSQTLVDDMQSFLSKKGFSNSVVDGYLSSANKQVAFRESHLKEMKNWLSQA